METIAYGVATRAPELERFVADPVRGVFAVVEAIGEGGERLVQSVSEVISHCRADHEQYTAVLQGQIDPLVAEHRGKSAVSFALVVRTSQRKIRWLRVGASGISLVRASGMIPLAVPQVANPRALFGEEIALPAAALGVGVEVEWTQGFFSPPPGEMIALHSSSFPLFTPGLQNELKALLETRSSGSAFQEAVHTLVERNRDERGIGLKGATLVLFEASH